MGRGRAAGDSPGWSLELAARASGFSRIAGVDEVGRGCLFGPVFAAAAVLDSSAPLPGLDDSKRLGPRQRSELDRQIRETAVAFAVAAADAATIDLLNILQASKLAMRLAVGKLTPAPDFLLLDAVAIDVAVPQRAIIRGDRKSCSIAAASILAKVARDRCMLAWDAVYPQYGLRSHKGYPVAAHLEAMRKHGCTPQHRRSFAPVARLTSDLPPMLAAGHPHPSD